MQDVPLCDSLIMRSPPCAGSLILLLENTGKAKNLSTGKQIHANAVVLGLCSNAMDVAVTVMYALCGEMVVAEWIFEKLSTKCTNAWNSMIRGHATKGCAKKALAFYKRMVGEGIPANNFTYPFVFKACSPLGAIEEGRRIHECAKIDGYESNSFVVNSILDMYVKCGCLNDARQVFDQTSARTTVSWNTMISGYLQNGYGEEALMVYDLMKDAGVGCDAATFVAVLPCCSSLKKLQKGREIHKSIDSLGLGVNLLVGNCLIDMYAKCGSLDDAHRHFDDMGNRDVVSWTAMIDGYIWKGDLTEALFLFRQMQISKVKPNSLTLSCLLSGCADACLPTHGKCIHGFSIRNHLNSDVFVQTALIDMYAKCGNLNCSLRLFLNSSRNRTVPWNAMIAGYTQAGLELEAMKFFKEMHKEEVPPDHATIVSVLPSYAKLSDLRQANHFHCHLIKIGLISAMEISTGVIDVYMKCGQMDAARNLFDGMREKDIISWSAIISGYGMHGDGQAALSLFNQMLQSGLQPNEVTFTSTIQACSHAGMLEEGMELFTFMVKEFKGIVSADHYACVIDLLARGDRLEEAHDLIKDMPFQPNYAVWGALLGGCVIHGNIELGELAAGYLFDLEPENTGNYVLLSNIYAASGRWEDAKCVRDMIQERGLRKNPGCSLVEVKRSAYPAANIY